MTDAPSGLVKELTAQVGSEAVNSFHFLSLLPSMLSALAFLFAPEVCREGCDSEEACVVHKCRGRNAPFAHNDRDEKQDQNEGKRNKRREFHTSRPAHSRYGNARNRGGDNKGDEGEQGNIFG